MPSSYGTPSLTSGDTGTCVVNRLCLTTLVAVAVALKLTEPIPAAAAVTVLVPATEPKVKDVLALPFVSVVALAGFTMPPPAVTLNVTAVPACGNPLVPLTCTTNRFDKVAPTVAVCPSPLTLLIVAWASDVNTTSRK